MPYFDPADLVRLDSILKDVEHEARNNSDLVKRLSEFAIKLKGDISEIKSTDPYSLKYIEQIRSVHEEIIGKEHSSAFEGLPVLNLDYESKWPYPWGTKSAETVGRFLIAYGFLIKTADLTPNARVLEVGCGMGSLTWNLARMGYRVDALDPNAKQCEVVSSFTRDFPTKPNVVPATLDQWLSKKPAHYKYDAVIFFESFHHLIDHKQCLETLLATHMEPDGKVLLAAEPVFETVCDLLPYPWGPRLDGESLRAMRNWGWLELGFTEDYIKGLFKDLGLSFEWLKCDAAAPHSQIVLGSRPTTNPITESTPSNHYDSNFSDGIDLSRDGLPRFVTGCTGVSHRENWGRWSIGDVIQIKFANKLPENFELKLNLVDVFGPNVHKKLKVKIGEQESESVLQPIESQSSYCFSFKSVISDLIEIAIPCPFRPKDMPELGNEDSRKIGIGIRSIMIDELA